MGNNEIKAVPESYVTSTLSPIILSESQHVQIRFEGRQVDNPTNSKRNIKGKIVIQKKAKKDDFSEIDKFSKKDIKLHDLVEIKLDTDETYALGKGLYNYFRLFSGKLTNPYDEVVYVIKDEQTERIKQLLEDNDNLLQILSQIDTSTLNAALSIENLKRIQRLMQDNMDNDEEVAFWQPFFEQNAWILSQLFHAPVMFFKGKRYVGGKGLDNRGGQYTDYIYKNDITDNVALIEIKTPRKPFFDVKYRQSYQNAPELTGGINQLLLQKDKLTKSYANLLMESGSFFRANSIECFLVYGNVSILSKEEKDALENYRNELRTVHIVGFDELLHRVNNIIKLLEGTPDISDFQETTDGELPF
jgi:hypothetical protein